MAIIIQDEEGTVTDANSYVDVSYADDYFSLRGSTSWNDLTTSQKEVCLIKSFDYLESNYSYKGNRLTKVQNTSFPRKSICVDGVLVVGIPQLLKKAQCELSVLASYQDLDNNFNYDDYKGYLASESIELVGAIKESQTYENSSFAITPYTIKYFNSAEKYIKPLTLSTGLYGNVSLIRGY